MYVLITSRKKIIVYYSLHFELNNIRSSITGFDDSEKVVRKSCTLGGLQEVTFLTEKGLLYKLLFRSRKQIAQKFQNWEGCGGTIGSPGVMGF